MTREEAIKILKGKMDGNTDTSYEWVETVRMAIKALEQEPCEDAISRARVVEWLHNCTDDSIEHAIDSNIEFIPSVNPQYTEEEMQKMQDLEQAEIQKAYELGKAEGQKSEDAISRQTAIDAFERFIHELGIEDEPYNYGEMALSVKNVPPVNPQPKTGHWVPIEYDGYADGNPVWDVWECSECGYEHYGDDITLTNFCPDCGAKMVEPQESE